MLSVDGQTCMCIDPTRQYSSSYDQDDALCSQDLVVAACSKCKPSFNTVSFWIGGSSADDSRALGPDFVVWNNVGGSQVDGECVCPPLLTYNETTASCQCLAPFAVNPLTSTCGCPYPLVLNPANNASCV